MPKQAPDAPLSKEHEEYAQAVATGFNAATAYRQYVAKPGTKMETCWNEGSKLLKNPRIAARVAELRKTAQEIVAQTYGHTAASHAKFLLDVMYKPVDEAEEGDMHIQRRRTRANGDEEIQLPGKLQAADQLANLLGYYPTDKKGAELLGASLEVVEALKEVLEAHTKS